MTVLLYLLLVVACWAALGLLGVWIAVASGHEQRVYLSDLGAGAALGPLLLVYVLKEVAEDIVIWERKDGE